MNIRRILTTLIVFAVLAVSQSVTANGTSFYRRASEAQVPIAGEVAMRLTTGTGGNISNVRIMHSSGSLDIDNSTVQWLGTQKMTPVLVNGQAQELSLVKEIKFSEAGKINQVSLE